MNIPSSRMSAYTSGPAITQAAKRTWNFYQSEIAKLDETKGKMLKEYKESGAWKEKYKSWAAACVPLEISRRYADELILKEEESKAGGTPPVVADSDDKAESVALKAVEEARSEPEEEDEEEKPAVHSSDEKVEPAKPINGHTVKAKPAMDLSGCVIPQRLLLMLERRDEVKQACQWASSLKSLFEKIQNEPDPLYFHVKNAGSVQTFMTGAATMRHQLAECSPDVVCPECGGKSESCHYCNGSGWICQVRWNREWVKSNDRLKGAEVAKRAANL